MKETILKTLLNRVNTNNEIGWKVIDADNVNLDNLANELLEAINYTHCSTQLPTEDEVLSEANSRQLEGAEPL